jgi:hypothetical protein
LVHQLERLGPAVTYRELMTGVRCHVENIVDRQSPVLSPMVDHLVDLPFLGGGLVRPVSTMTMRCVRGVWEIDAGACHGMIAGADDDPTRVGVPGTEPVREARVIRVHADRSTVEPIGEWAVVGEQYPIVLTRVPLPPTTVTINGADGDPLAVALLRTALDASPHVREIRSDEANVQAELEIVIGPGTARITSAGRQDDPQPLVPDRPVTTLDEAKSVVSDLEHIARWRQIKVLDNGCSGLRNAVWLELLATRPGELVAPAHGEALTAGEDGAVVLDYRWGESGAVAPQVFVKLHNDTDRDLYCALLDLTDLHRVSPNLFPGAMVGAHRTAWVAGGRPIELSLPPGRAAVPGAEVRDWFKLLVCEERFSTEPFRLGRLDEPARRRVPTLRSAAYQSVVERLGMIAMNRDAEVSPAAAADWCTSILPVTTRVPHRDAPR